MPLGRYRFWGGRLDSDLALPELLPWSGADTGRPADITIRRAALGPDLAAEVWSDHHARLARDNRFQVDDPPIARFQGRDGTEVVVDPLCDPTDRDRQAMLRGILYGTVLGGLCLQRGLLGLHATSLVADGRAVLLLGDRGSGKSTLAAALWRRGCAILADDLSAVTTGPEGCRLLPGFPGLRLTAAAAARLSLPVPSGVDRIGGRLMLSPLATPWDRPAPPWVAVHLETDPAAGPPTLERLPPLAAVARLHRQIFRYGLGAAMGLGPALFATSARAAAAIPRHVVLRHAPDMDRLDRLAGLVLDALVR